MVRSSGSETVLARTQVVAPVTTEWGCRNCHGGPWRVGGRAGISEITAEDVLSVHDKFNRTTLRAAARAGQPRACQDCHADPSRHAVGDPSVLSLSAAIHGFHANYLAGRDAEACLACHPARPTGATRFFRGRHAESLDCTHCHGAIEDHALSLLKP